MDKNIIFIFSDQQRWDTLGCYGQKLDVTPNLDKLALEGAKFNNSYTCQPVCGPARAALQTGKYPTSTGNFINGISLEEGEKTIAKVLSKNGYETAYIGKWHLASDDGIEEYFRSGVPLHKRGGYNDYWMASDILEFTSHGYDGYVFDRDMRRVDFTGYRVDAMTDYAIDFLEDRNREKPFFMFLSYIEPHHQNDRKTYEGPDYSKGMFRDFELPKDLAGENEAHAMEEYPDYLGCCHSIDANVGRLRSTLEKLGDLKNTIIIYTSDHGCHFKTRNRNLDKPGGDDYKRSCHDASIKTPLIIYGSELRGEYDELVSLIDLPPTILKLARIEGTESMDGKDISLKVEEGSELAFIQISESIVGRAIRTKKYKYCVYGKGLNPWKVSSSKTYSDYCLYDLESDPLEKNNLIDVKAYKEVKEILRERLKEEIFRVEGDRIELIED